MQLSLTLLTRSETFYTSARLIEVARERGIEVHCLDSGLSPDAGRQWLDKRGALPDLVIPRIGSQCTRAELALLSTIIDLGVFSPATPEALWAAMDKGETQRRLEQAGLPTLPTELISEPDEAPGAAKRVGKGPWVLKPRLGSQGRDVCLVRETSRLVERSRELLARNTGLVLQPLVAMSPPRDLRVLVIEGSVRTACWRVAAKGEFRSNVHLGARTLKARLDTESVRLAEAAARALKLAHAGVDLLPLGPEGPPYVVLEVNGSPGLEGIERTTGLNLAGEVLDAVLRALGNQRARR